VTSAELLKAASPALLSPSAGIATPLVAYLFGLAVQKRCGGAPFANPTLIGVAITAAVAMLLPDNAAGFRQGTDALFWLVGPATVAFAAPLYRSRALILAAGPQILCAIAFGAVAALSIASACALAMRLPTALVLSVAPKSATAAIAIGVADRLGGVSSITAPIVTLTGLTTAVSATLIFDWLGLRDPRARGLAAGICGHALATARMLQIDATAGAFASLAIGPTALGTALCAPILSALLRG
jgi:putative effector of murein hydrolase